MRGCGGRLARSVRACHEASWLGPPTISFGQPATPVCANTWTASEDLPVCLSGRIFQTYVRPSASFGLEFVMDEPELQRLNAWFSQWGRTPAHVAPRSTYGRRLRHVEMVVSRYSNATYDAALLATESLSSLAHWQPVPNLHTIVYGRHVLPVLARYWGLARCGHHCFGDGRSARHRGDAPRPCRFCAHERDSLHHALLECNAHRIWRERWQARTAHQSLDQHVLFCTNPGMNTHEPVKLFRTFALWTQFVKQLMRVKCDGLFPACLNGACTYIGVHVSQL